MCLTMTIVILLLCLVPLLLWTHWRWTHEKTVILGQKLDGPYAYPVIGNAFIFGSGDYLGVIQKLDLQYGQLKWFRFWVGYWLIIGVQDPESMEKILNSKGALEKAIFYKLMAPVFNNGLIASDSEVWHYNRKVVAPTFNIFKIKTYTEAFIEESEELARSWKDKIGKKFSPFYDSVGLFFSFPLRSAMGDKVFHRVTRNMDLYNFANEIRTVIKIVSQRYFNPLLYFDCIFKLTPAYKKFKKILGMYDDLLEEMVRAKREDCNDDNTFLSHVIKAEKNYPKFQHRQILDELKTYISAGFETTATTASLVFIMLGIHSDIQERVFKEQVEILDEMDGKPTFDDLNKMAYLEQVIKETLRLFPTIPIFSREISDDVIIGDKIIPKGCTVGFFPYLVHRREENYPNPLVFNPDRFLPEEEKKRHPYTFIPFGGGPRTCLGQRYAMYAMKAFISSVIRHYKIHTDYGLDHVLKTIRTSIELLVEDYEISLSSR